jgi:hypothetical protein
MGDFLLERRLEEGTVTPPTEIAILAAVLSLFPPLAA